MKLYILTFLSFFRSEYFSFRSGGIVERVIEVFSGLNRDGGIVKKLIDIVCWCSGCTSNASYSRDAVNRLLIVSLQSLYYFTIGIGKADRYDVKQKLANHLLNGNDSFIYLVVHLFQTSRSLDVRYEAIQLLGAFAAKDHDARCLLAQGNPNLAEICSSRLEESRDPKEILGIFRTLSILAGETHGTPGHSGLTREFFQQVSI